MLCAYRKYHLSCWCCCWMSWWRKCFSGYSFCSLTLIVECVLYTSNYWIKLNIKVNNNQKISTTNWGQCNLGQKCSDTLRQHYRSSDCTVLLPTWWLTVYYYIYTIQYAIDKLGLGNNTQTVTTLWTAESAEMLRLFVCYCPTLTYPPHFVLYKYNNKLSTVMWIIKRCGCCIYMDKIRQQVFTVKCGGIIPPKIRHTNGVMSHHGHFGGNVPRRIGWDKLRWVCPTN